MDGPILGGQRALPGGVSGGRGEAELGREAAIAFGVVGPVAVAGGLLGVPDVPIVRGAEVLVLDVALAGVAIGGVGPEGAARILGGVLPFCVSLLTSTPAQAWCNMFVDPSESRARPALA